MVVHGAALAASCFYGYSLQNALSWPVFEECNNCSNYITSLIGDRNVQGEKILFNVITIWTELDGLFPQLRDIIFDLMCFQPPSQKEHIIYAIIQISIEHILHLIISLS